MCCFKRIFLNSLVIAILASCATGEEPELSSSGAASEETLNPSSTAEGAEGEASQQEIDAYLEESENPQESAEELKKQLQDEPVEVLEVEDPIDPATQGVVQFFSGSKKGVVVKKINWFGELAQDNPGVDCKLKKRSPGLYNCVVGERNEAAVLTVREEKDLTRPKKRKLNRITFDGKGASNKNRISKELLENGYKSLGKLVKNAIEIESFIELQNPKTRADLLWVAKKQSFTLILRPGSGVSKKAKPKGSKRQAAGTKTKVKKVKN